MNNLRVRSAIALAILTALAAAGGFSTASAQASKSSAANVTVKLNEFKLIPSVRVVAAGNVTFVARNAGQLAHELVVLRTGTPAGKLPLSGMRAQEAGRIATIAQLEPGATKTITLTLKKGHYVLLCNLPGHYSAGQRADFTVR